jgi:Glu-tRNA(Gln) amidotransferase subunit E-like FAD-binding protein
MGDIDVAAEYETLKNKVFRYKVYKNESCAVELDEEPPHPINMQALEIALKISLMFNCEIPEEIEVMRKTVLDGSNTSGFQRSALVGLNGWMQTSFGKVGINKILLEEEAAKIIRKDGKESAYGLNRLGIPMVEIVSDPDARAPEQVKEIAEKIGMILRSTGNVMRGIGTIRQDINISIAKGARCEIKGVQDIRLVPKVVDLEIMRQNEIVKKGKKVTNDVRKVLPSGKTEFMRPLPGAARLYPETDIPPIQITKSMIGELKMALPELLDERREKIARKYKLNEEIAGQITSSGRIDLFERLAKIGDPRTVANVLTKYSREYRLPDSKLEELFKSLGRKEIPKENLEAMLDAVSKGKTAKEAMKSSSDGMLSEAEIENISGAVITKNPNVMKAGRPEQALMGLVMREVKGRAPGSLVMKVIQKKLKKK